MFSIIKDREITSDVVQDIYFIVFKNIKSIRDEKLFLAWLNKVTYTRAIKEISKIRKQPISITDQEIELRLGSNDNDDILSKFINKEFEKEVMQYIMGLKEKYRVVIILKYFNNYKIKEISEIIGIPEGTVKSRLNTAKRELKDRLYEKYSKVMVVLGFGFIISSTLKVTAKASVIGSTGVVNRSFLDVIKNISKDTLIKGAVAISLVPIGIFMINSNNAARGLDIINVEYNTAFTNKSVEVTVTINNLDKNDHISVIRENKDIINVNKTNSNIISFIAEYNGDYIVNINSGELSKHITINNIDYEAPVIKKSSNNGDILNLVLSDNLSGINYELLEAYSENNKINVGQREDTISIKANRETIYLKVYDNAGNLSVYTIESIY